MSCMWLCNTCIQHSPVFLVVGCLYMTYCNAIFCLYTLLLRILRVLTASQIIWCHKDYTTTFSHELVMLQQHFGTSNELVLYLRHPSLHYPFPFPPPPPPSSPSQFFPPSVSFPPPLPHHSPSHVLPLPRPSPSHVLPPTHVFLIPTSSLSSTTFPTCHDLSHFPQPPRPSRPPISFSPRTTTSPVRATLLPATTVIKTYQAGKR